LAERFPSSDFGEARDKAAEKFEANPHYVTDAKQIAKDAPEILEHVKQGKLEKQLAVEAKKRQLATQNNNAGRAASGKFS